MQKSFEASLPTEWAWEPPETISIYSRTTEEHLRLCEVLSEDCTIVTHVNYKMGVLQNVAFYNIIS
jgi:hypothetical protein